MQKGAFSASALPEFEDECASGGVCKLSVSVHRVAPLDTLWVKTCVLVQRAPCVGQVRESDFEPSAALSLWYHW